MPIQNGTHQDNEGSYGMTNHYYISVKVRIPRANSLKELPRTFPSATDVLIFVSYQFMICKSVCHFFLQHYLDPPKEVKKALESKGLPLEDFFVMKHGESRLLLEEMEMD